MEKLHLPIIIEMDEDVHYIVSCPLFKGCHSYGETIDEAVKNIREVIDICIGETEVKELNKFVGSQLAEMATDPEIQAELRDIDREFAVTEADGLES